MFAVDSTGCAVFSSEVFEALNLTSLELGGDGATFLKRSKLKGLREEHLRFCSYL